jgi:hypothetical protein
MGQAENYRLGMPNIQRPCRRFIVDWQEHYKTLGFVDVTF